MKVSNIRLGKAQNSSSSHSLIFLPGHKHEDEDVGDYGWSDFTLASAAAKRDYLGATLFEALAPDLGKDLALHVVYSLLGVEWEANEESGKVEAPGIDHQSVLALPRGWDRKGVDLDFLAELRQLVERPDVLILGGNDNEGSHPLASAGDRLIEEMPREYHERPFVARRDPSGWWTLYNYRNGSKIRLALDDAPPFKKATLPELVDVKISDYCTLGCPYCYQDSTAKGKHADSYYLSQLAHALGENRVFEVAIGGGEPTFCPHLSSFMTSCRWAGVQSVAFTTKTLEWTLFPGRVANYFGDKENTSFAYSVTSKDDVAGLVEAATRLGIDHKASKYAAHSSRSETAPITAQLVMGTVERFDFVQIVRACRKANVDLTLLGYKTNGRGTRVTPTPYHWWIDVIKEQGTYGIRIDTQMARQYEQQLQEAEVSPLTYHTDEGAFSCYIDAVSQRMYASSYEDDPGAFVHLKNPTDDLGLAFARLQAKDYDKP